MAKQIYLRNKDRPSVRTDIRGHLQVVGERRSIYKVYRLDLHPGIHRPAKAGVHNAGALGMPEHINQSSKKLNGGKS